MSSYGWIEDAFRDWPCVGCGELMPRGYRHFVHDLYGTAFVLRRYHVHCARAAGLRARCLEPKAKRCQRLED